ncbi:MAG TPA: DUF1015 domain-containing protein [Ruminococcaceae bacterium]|nr:DUF1015 domain-containing protein [Oscillospiraceae bacterium]
MNTAFGAADILLPVKTDMEKWAVAACDQYTGEPEYWARVENRVGDSPSTLGLILPEVYLEETDVDARIDRIHENMRGMLESGFFRYYSNAMIYVERTQSDGMVRRGIVGAIDLEQYDYHVGSSSSVRATEATVAERIPPRLKVRMGAQIELPHVLVLIDDAERTVIDPCKEIRERTAPIYDTPLMEGGGKIRGYLLDDAQKKRVEAALEKLNDNDAFNRKYGISGYPTLLYAVGDGNHSLATAKEYYERLKAANPGKDLSDHPARYALAEIVNLHSRAIRFEAIQRIVMGVDTEKFMREAEKKLGLNGELSSQRFIAVVNGSERLCYIHNRTSELSVGSLQDFIDEYLAKNGGKVDYIHGADVVKQLSKKEGNIGFILPDMQKTELFPTVIKDGALPRKTFSMGHAADKRFYMECRKIVL